MSVPSLIPNFEVFVIISELEGLECHLKIIFNVTNKMLRKNLV